MTNNAPDYTDNLAFPPHTILTAGGVIRVEGDWADTKPLNTHDSAQFEVELVGKIEQLTSELNHLKTLCWNVCYGEDMWGLWATGQSFTCWNEKDFDGKQYLGSSKGKIDSLFEVQDEM